MLNTQAKFITARHIKLYDEDRILFPGDFIIIKFIRDGKEYVRRGIVFEIGLNSLHLRVSEIFKCSRKQKIKFIFAKIPLTDVQAIKSFKRVFN